MSSHQATDQNKSIIKIVHFNANSLLAHIDQVRHYALSNTLHIISISESWLHELIPDELIRIEGYFIIRNDRITARGGGVICYIKNSLKAKILAVSSGQILNDPEFVLLEITHPTAGALLFTCMYRRPKGSFLNDYFNVFNRFSHAYNNIVLTGDLNCNMLSNDIYARHLKDLIFSQSLYLVDSEATHHTNSSDSWLDIFIIDDISKLYSFTKSEAPFIAGHDLLELSYTFNCQSVNPHLIHRRSFTHFNESSFLTTLNELSSDVHSQLTQSSDSISTIDNIFSHLSSITLSALNTHAPLRAFKVSKPQTPWITVDLTDRIKMRTTLYKKAKKSGCVLDYSIYKNFRNNLTADLRKARTDYQFNRLSNIQCPSKMWRELENLGLVKASLASPLHFFTPDQLNNYYSSITYSDSPCFHSDLIDILTTTPCRQPSFSFSQITPGTILNFISAAVNSYSCGPDGLSPIIIKKASPVLLPSLTILFNKFITLSFFPTIWKQAFIRPLLKTRIPISPSDTRPIANLCELSKIFEKILSQQIVTYINSRGILDPKQSGYRCCYSTQTALLSITDFASKGIDDGLITILVLFDFSKAFDTICHRLLLVKLRQIGFSDSATSLIFSYLTNRSQAVRDNEGSTSSWQSTTTGVPQGSVLGPLLFSLFINDIGSVLTHSEHLIFADDTQIFLRIHPSLIQKGIQLMSTDVKAIFQYSKSNSLKLNIAKSKVLIIGSRRHISNIDYNTLPTISVEGITLPYVTEARNLGVTLSSDLTWNRHISHISQKVHSTLHKLKYHKNALSTELRTKLITTLIFPHFDYCCLVYNSLTDELNTKLQRLLNCCIRFIFDIRRNVHITPYRLQLNWLSVRNRRLYFLGISIYQLLSTSTPSYLYNIFSFLDPLLRRSSRTHSPSTIFSIPQHRTSTYRNSYALAAIYWWHSLSEDITSSPSVSVFKIRLRNFLLATEREQVNTM